MAQRAKLQLALSSQQAPVDKPLLHQKTLPTGMEHLFSYLKFILDLPEIMVLLHHLLFHQDHTLRVLFRLLRIIAAAAV